MKFFVFFALMTSALPCLAADKPCPVTTPPNPPFVPPAPFEPNAGKGSFWYGTPSLWGNLQADGVWRALPHDDKGYSNKLFLWQQDYDWRKEPQPDIIVVLRRLDAEAPLVNMRGGTHAIFDGTASMLIGVTVPTVGCWEVTSYHDGHTLAFVVSVQP